MQATEFLLLTTAETLNNPDPEGARILEQLPRDRGEFMTKLRDRYPATHGMIDREMQETLYVVTEAFARQVLFAPCSSSLFQYSRFLDRRASPPWVISTSTPW